MPVTADGAKGTCRLSLILGMCNPRRECNFGGVNLLLRKTLRRNGVVLLAFLLADQLAFLPAAEPPPPPAAFAQPTQSSPISEHPAKDESPSLSVKNGRFYKDGKPYRAVGVNYFDLFLRVLRAPTNTASLTGLQQLGQAGIPFVRFAVGYHDADWNLFFVNRDEYFRRLDLVVQTARRAKVGLIPSLFWNFQSFPALAREPGDQWGVSGSKTSDMMREFVGAVVERYKDTPEIWAWEFGNEPNLAVDLPNAAEIRARGRTEQDDIKSSTLVVMLAEFAREVRRHDAFRPILSGNSHPRPSAWHNTAEKSWQPDTRAQTLEILQRDNPAPLDTVGIHIYGYHSVPKDVAAWANDSAEYLAGVREVAEETKRPVFVGEFNLNDPADSMVTADSRARFVQLLADLDRAKVDLAALWVFDLKIQDKDFSASFENQRSYMLKLVAEANQRWNKSGLVAAH